MLFNLNYICSTLWPRRSIAFLLSTKLKTKADYYVFELQDKVADIDEWGDINQAFQTNNNKGQGQPNKVERDFTNPMRIIGKKVLLS